MADTDPKLIITPPVEGAASGFTGAWRAGGDVGGRRESGPRLSPGGGPRSPPAPPPTWESGEIRLPVLAAVLVVPEVRGLAGKRPGAHQLAALPPHGLPWVGGMRKQPERTRSPQPRANARTQARTHPRTHMRARSRAVTRHAERGAHAQTERRAPRAAPRRRQRALPPEALLFSRVCQRCPAWTGVTASRALSAARSQT